MQTRNAHTPKPLKYPIENGLGDFLPPAALKMIAVDYQHGLLERLNEQVKGQ
jgi:Fe-Mn family superoxide dismutase